MGTPVYKYQKQKVIIEEELLGSSATPVQTIVVDIVTRERIMVDGLKLKSTAQFLSSKKIKKIKGMKK